MASSPYHAQSSPRAPDGDGRCSNRSRFTYRQFTQLATYNTNNPLRVIAHIDLDAFYAQCEMIRLGTPEDTPLAVQQWQALIAVNYPARESGVNRHCNVTEAKKLCPELIAQHVATWREGDTAWAYRDDAAAHIVTDKVSLDPYRLESRKILGLIRDSLPPSLQKVEKASIDEVFLDLSAHVHSIMLQRFPELSGPAPYDDPTEMLPLPSVVALDWKADALIDLNEDEETQDPDWDDVAIMIGAEIVRDVRTQVREKLGYTCSAGVASNKLLSKLGSGFKKPNYQTVVRNRAVDLFLKDFKFTKMRNLGGKLGDQVVAQFNTDNVQELLNVTLDQLKSALGDDTGSWVHNTIRGIDHSEVNPRTQIKSMLSAKSFRPYIKTTEQAVKWFTIFVADIYGRLVEEGVLENKRRPRTIHLGVKHASQTRTRQGPIPQGKLIDEGMLLSLANDLFTQILSEGSVWPCHHLNLSVGGFEEGIKNNMGIGAFLVKGDDAISLRVQNQEERLVSPDRPAKKPRHTANEAGGGIRQFFNRKQVTHDDDTGNAFIDKLGQAPSLGFGKLQAKHGMPLRGEAGTSETGNTERAHFDDDDDDDDDNDNDNDDYANDEERDNNNNGDGRDLLTCSRCAAQFADVEELLVHQDWHVAKDLQDEADQEEARSRPKPTQQSSARVAPAKTTNKRSGRGGGTSSGSKREQGQSLLKFG